MTAAKAERLRVQAAARAIVAPWFRPVGQPAEPSRRPLGEDVAHRADHVAIEGRRALIGVAW